MKQVGFSYKLIPSDADFIKFAIKFNILIVATMISLWITRGETEFIDFGNLEVSKVTFRETMGLLAMMLASAYWSGNTHCFVNALIIGDDSSGRIYIEMAMVYGFLSLTFLLMNLYGFFWGIICLPISPPSLLLSLQFVKRNAKEFQD